MNTITNKQLAEALRTVIDHEKSQIEAMQREAIRLTDAIEVRAANLLIVQHQLYEVEGKGTR